MFALGNQNSLLSTPRITVDRNVADRMTVAGPSGAVTLRAVGSANALMVLEGLQYPQFVLYATEFLDGIIEQHGTLAFATDTSSMSTYHPEFRTLWSKWLKRNRDKISVNYVLSSSALITLGINAVSMVTPGLVRAFSDPREFWRCVYKEFGHFESANVPLFENV